MKTEFEATFCNIDKEAVQKALKEIDAVRLSPEFLQKRVVFDLPKGHEIPGGWLRVRQEANGATMSLKAVTGDKITDQRETQLRVDDFDTAVEFLKEIGAKQKSYQENKRERWTLDGVEVTIDEWPFLEPFVEVEGRSEKVVRDAAQKLGFNYADAKFCAVGTQYAEKYNLPDIFINKNVPKIVFGMENPFLS